jgi:tRNA A-37 threonylcarbamoyl transferase component Bud32
MPVCLKQSFICRKSLVAVKAQWVLCGTSDAESEAFSSFSRTWDSTGAKLDGNPMSSLVKVSVGCHKYYIKKYAKRGRFLRRIIGRSRVRAEWENVRLLHQLGIPTVDLVAYGEESRFIGNRRGMLVTREIARATDLVSLLEHSDACFRRGSWVDIIIERLSIYVRTMHGQRFVHNDLKWRNILADYGDDPEVYIIDCPAGRHLGGVLVAPLLKRGIIKDLACLDKVARHVLRRSQRLKFYLLYSGLKKLDKVHKKRIRKILSFFEGRQ